MTDKAGVILFVTLLGMTFCTVIHLHAVPCVFLPARDIFSPYADGVAGDTIGLIFRQSLGLGMVSVAGGAFQFTHLDMGYMGKIDAVRCLE
jgi:hypothetical protein